MVPHRRAIIEMWSNHTSIQQYKSLGKTPTRVFFCISPVVDLIIWAINCVRFTSKTTHAMNMGSYNYLGFAQSSGRCADEAETAVHQHGVSVCSSRHELGMFTQDFTGHSTYTWSTWLSGRTSVSGQHSFVVLCSTCSWGVTTYVGKPSAIGPPTRPTQPFILLGSINE